MIIIMQGEPSLVSSALYYTVIDAPKYNFYLNVPTHASLYFRLQILRATLSQTLIFTF